VLRGFDLQQATERRLVLLVEQNDVQDANRAVGLAILVSWS
jgi:hypothetical protein